MARVTGVAIHGYGGYVPRYRIRAEEIGRIWNRGDPELPVNEKTVAAPDEDATTMAVEAARIAVKMAGIDPRKIGAIHVGSESKPYAVKPTGTVVSAAIGAGTSLLAADLEFACKAGTEALQLITGLVETGRIEYGLAIGADTAQGRPGDALEFTAASGAAAFLVGSMDNAAVASIEAWCSYVTDTPDFWRRPNDRYPMHTARFTGQPAYFRHIIGAVKSLMDNDGYSLNDFDYFVFHQPNVKFPLAVAKSLGVDEKKIAPGLVADVLGNTYSACSLLGLVKVLDSALPGQAILLASYGSGAGSDAFVIRVLEGISEKRERVPKLSSLINDKIYVDYAVYLKFREKISMR
ncbi:MAG: hydroxymethylglutaryl-CoA synthase [Aigarchaeota archaeon]|nr:hydroxymethylglutaryl-CoA synthase [Aigarchaeota archaeon]MDW8021098.1 hydroxymethylglutaryl-CoA synthase [Nitrososphaerota archaeon]